jgi:hypothetical protein
MKVQEMATRQQGARDTYRKREVFIYLFNGRAQKIINNDLDIVLVAIDIIEGAPSSINLSAVLSYYKDK